MTTIKLTIEYDGSRYPGFSTKKKSTSIESKLTLAIRDVTGQSTQLFAAVKTEPGVHATHQIVSFQLEKESFSKRKSTSQKEKITKFVLYLLTCITRPFQTLIDIKC